MKSKRTRPWVRALSLSGEQGLVTLERYFLCIPSSGAADAEILLNLFSWCEFKRPTRFPLWPSLRVGLFSPFSLVALFEQQWDCGRASSDMFPMNSTIFQQSVS